MLGYIKQKDEKSDSREYVRLLKSIWLSSSIV